MGLTSLIKSSVAALAAAFCIAALPALAQVQSDAVLAQYALAVQQQPESRALRLQYSGALFAAGRYDAAKAQALRVLHDPRSAPDEAQVLSALDLIARADSVDLAVFGSIMPSDNIRGAATARYIDTALGRMWITGGGDRQTGIGLRLGGALRYTAVPLPGERAELGFALTRVHYPNAAEQSRWEAAPSLTWRVLRHSYEYDAHVAVRRYSYDQPDANNTVYALSAGLRDIVSDRLSWSVRLGQDWVRNDSRDHLDGTMHYATLSAQFRPSDRVRLHASARGQQRSARLEHNGFAGAGLSVGADWALTRQDQLSAELSADWRTYAAPTPGLLGAVRSDQSHSAELGLTTARITLFGAAPKISCRYSQTQSTIALYTTRRTDCGLSLERSF